MPVTARLITSDTDRKHLAVMVEAHWSQAKMARFFGVSQVTVSRAIARDGLKPRPWRTGTKANRWRGGTTLTPGGYIREMVHPDDPMRAMASTNGYVLQHRLVMARSLNRCLDPKETVHHINGDPGDNRLENLQLRQGRHGKGFKIQCLDCGSHNVTGVALDDD